VAQEARLLRLEIVQARAQPLEPLAEVADVLRAVDDDGVREVRGSHLADREVELADRARDQHGEEDRERDRDGGRREREPQPGLPRARRRDLQPLDRALRELRRGREHRLRLVDELGEALGEADGIARRARSRRARRRARSRDPSAWRASRARTPRAAARRAARPVWRNSWRRRA
jgi:hypothetical protein